MGNSKSPEHHVYEGVMPYTIEVSIHSCDTTKTDAIEEKFWQSSKAKVGNLTSSFMNDKYDSISGVIQKVA